MDIFAHALWTNAVYETASKPRRSLRNILEVLFWSNFPDFFSFGILFVINIVTWSSPARAGSYEEQNFPAWLYNMHHILYSLPLYFLIFGLLWLIFKKPYWPIGGWFIHIFIDVLTHTSFFPPHFLWPFSDFHLELTTWASPTFMAINYVAIIVVYTVLYFFRFRPRKKIKII